MERIPGLMQRFPGLLCLAQAETMLGPRLAPHENRVGMLAAFLCEKLGTGTAFAADMKIAARFHDIGKLVVPDPIIGKPGSLTAEEWAAIKRHPECGHSILEGTSEPLLELAATTALTHQERFDGSGYPNGLAGWSIPLPGRIASLCDVYDALREDRVYRAGLDHTAAVQIIVAGDGRTKPAHFDPQVLGAFHAHEAMFARVYSEGGLVA